MSFLTRLLALGMVEVTMRAFGEGERRGITGLPEGDSFPIMILWGLDGVTSIFMSAISSVATTTDGCVCFVLEDAPAVSD